MTENTPTSERTDRPTPTVRESEPPMPDVGYRIVNPLVSALLRSPLHSLVSDSIMLITFTGRKSGQEYTTPVGYLQDGERLVVFTHSQWWKNLRGGQPVSLHLRGETRSGIATPDPDPETVAEHVLRLVDEHGPGRARRVGFVIEGDGTLTKDAVADAVENTVVVEIELDPAPDESELDPAPGNDGE